MKYYIPDCYWPVDDNGTYKSHEAISILNTSSNDIVVDMTLYFEDREKMEGFALTVPAERTIHFHTYKLKNNEGKEIPRGVGYAAVIESQVPVAVQYTRVDTTQKELALMSAMAVEMHG